ncbi:MAG: hypothetical protein N7Q72_02240, partial [Spiroplasma sp. Tabriz.8]|nr:hypothetical protein [Spiroplasma sp. Tabriz.8]
HLLFFSFFSFFTNNTILFRIQNTHFKLQKEGFEPIFKKNNNNNNNNKTSYLLLSYWDDLNRLFKYQN